jgi:hypothetical protein
MSTLPKIAMTVTTGCGITFRHTTFEVLQGVKTRRGCPRLRRCATGGAAAVSAFDQRVHRRPANLCGRVTRDAVCWFALPAPFPYRYLLHDIEDHGVVINGWEDARR